MKTCCFCFDIKHGSNASATFTLVTKLIGVIILTAVLIVVRKQESPPLSYQSHIDYPEKLNDFEPQNNFEKDSNLLKETSKKQYLEYEEELTFTYIYLGVLIGLGILSVSFSIMLLVGIKKGIKCLFFPWIIYTSFEVGGSAIMTIRTLTVIGYAGGAAAVIAAGYLIGGLFETYMLWCVIAHLKSLSATTTYAPEFSAVNVKIYCENDIPYKVEKDTVPLV